MEAIRILVSGSRSFSDARAMYRAFNHLQSTLDENTKMHLIHGGARGADEIAAEWPDWDRIFEFEAEWNKYGRSAGFRRNEEMLHYGKPHMLIAFPASTSKGTRHMITAAQKEELPTVVFES